MSLVLALLLTLLIAWLVIGPALSQDLSTQSEGSEHPGQELQAKKERLLQSLREVELDHSTDKISESDYKETRLEITSELASTYKELDSGRSK